MAYDQRFLRLCVFLSAAIGAFMLSFTSGSLMSVMLDIKSDLNMGPITAEWMVTGFTAITCGLVCVFGQYGDVIGHFKVLLLGLLAFFIGNFLYALGLNMPLLMVGTVFRGIGAACIMPASISVIRIIYPPEKLVHAITLWSIIVFVGWVAGPFFAGLGALADWRIVFWVSSGALFIAFFLLYFGKSINVQVIDKTNKIDWIGTILLSTSIITFVIMITEGNFWGWSSGATITLYCVSFISLIGFLISQKYVKKPILVYSELSQYSFWAGMVISFVNLFVFYSFFYFYNLYAQSNVGLDYSSFLSGTTLLPFGIWIVAVFFVSKKLVNLLGVVWVFTLGSLITFAGVFLLLWINPEIGYVNLWWKLCLAGIGIGFIFPVVGSFSVGKIDSKYTGMASGLISSTYYIGATLGVTLCSLWYMSYARSFLSTNMAKLNLSKIQVDSIVDASHTSVTKLNSVLSGFSPEVQINIKSVLSNAVAGGFGRAGLLMAILAAVGFVFSVSLLFIKNKK